MRVLGDTASEPYQIVNYGLGGKGLESLFLTFSYNSSQSYFIISADPKIPGTEPGHHTLSTLFSI